jgi:outer membrane receptor for ferrienterochelin and colicin
MTKRTPARAALAASLLLAPALAAQSDSTPAQPAVPAAAATQPVPAARPRASRNLITAEEIAAHPARDLYELVRALRPVWMRGNAASITDIRRDPENGQRDIRARLVVMHDGSRMGELEELRRIPIETVGEVRYLDSRDAVARYGGEFSGGAILVNSR